MDKPWKVVAAFLGVFIAGAVFGGFFSLGIGRRVWQIESSAVPATANATVAGKTAQPPPPQRPLLQAPAQWTAPQLLMRFVQRLDLTQDQQARVKPLLQRAAEDFRRQQVNNLRETNFILQRMNQDLKKELTVDQTAKLEKMEQRQREQMQKALGERFGKRNGTGPGAKGAPEGAAEPKASEAPKMPEPESKPPAPVDPTVH